MPKHEELSPSRRDFLIQMFEDVYNVYNGFKPLHSRRSSEPLRKAILRAWTRERRFDDMPRCIKRLFKKKNNLIITTYKIWLDSLWMIETHYEA